MTTTCFGWLSGMLRRFPNSLSMAFSSERRVAAWMYEVSFPLLQTKSTSFPEKSPIYTLYPLALISR